MKRAITTAALASLGALVFGVYACSEDATEETNPTTGSGANGGGTTASTGSNAGGSFQGVGGGAGGGDGGSCAALQVEATIEYKPADIIFIIDNSGSMSDEINQVEQNINVNFAGIIQSSGVDYQVIMITDHGTNSYDVCIGPPLSGTSNCAGDPVFVPGQFYHYDRNVQSSDSVCRMFATMNGQEQAENPSLAPNGWLPWLRPEAVKVFVEITDDLMSCTWDNTSFNGSTAATGQAAALAFDDKLLGLAPGQFGTVSNRNYIFYSIVGLASKPPPNELSPYTEFEDIVQGTCSSAYNAGFGYQWLSKGTHALRFPVCNTQSYDAVFQDIAAGVIDVTQVPCSFDVPEADPGQMLDYNTTTVIYTPGGSGTPQSWTKVDSVSQCGPGKFYIDDTVTPNKIILCDQACDVVENDSEAKLEVKIDCIDIAD